MSDAMIARMFFTMVCSFYLGMVVAGWMFDGAPPGIMLPLILGAAAGCVSYLTWAVLKMVSER